MKLFACQNCGQPLYFENTLCERCGHTLGYLPEAQLMSALEPKDDVWRPLAAPKTKRRFCANSGQIGCNWLLPPDAQDGFCEACRLNRTIPDLSVQGNVDLWRNMEQAKRRMMYSLQRLGLRLAGKEEEPETGVAFDFLSPDAPSPDGGPVMTGHDEGLITINLQEADPVEREKNRDRLHEHYRTLLGHFRHEIGHYYWDRLVQDAGKQEDFRAVFGDEQADYAAALEQHYQNGPPQGWQQNYLSAYATAHPWEDFAESWAHYLHMVDTLESAAAFGLRTDPPAAREKSMATVIATDPYREDDFDVLMKAWLPLTYAMNSLNQSMGQPQLYPFVLAPAVVDKLRFVHDLIRTARQPAKQKGGVMGWLRR